MTTAVIETPQVPAEGATTTTPPATTPPPAATTTPPPVTTPAATTTTTTTPPAAATPPATTAGETTAPPPAAAIPVALAMTDVPEADRPFVGEEDLAYIAAVAKASGWSQEDAQIRLSEDIEERKFLRSRLFEEITADTYIGGDKLTTTQQLAKSGIEALLPADSPTLMAYRTRLERDMQRLGLNNYAPLVALLAEAGKKNREDSPTHSIATGATEEAKPFEERFGWTKA